MKTLISYRLHVSQLFSVFTNNMTPARYCALLAFVIQAGAQGRPVEGVVIDPVTSSGVAGATVIFYTPQAVRYQATTDASGAFKIAQMGPGEFRAIVEKDGFAVFPAPALKIEPDESTTPARVRYELQFAAKQDSKLSGRVLDSQGKPLELAAVDLIRGPEYRFRAFTDAQGHFAFDQLAPGAYKLRAAPPAAGAGVATYFPSAIEESGAERIIIRGTAEIDGFRLRTAPVVHVRGVAVQEDGKPAPQAIVRLAPMIPQPAHVVASLEPFFTVAGGSLGPGPDEARVVTGDDGSFEFPAVRAGEWRIVANLEEASGVMPVIVQQSDVENIRVRIEPLLTIKASARWALSCVMGRLVCGGKAADGAVFPMWFQALDGQPSLLTLGVAQTDGAFAIEHIPQGRYRVLTFAPFVDGHVVPGAQRYQEQLDPGSQPMNLTYHVSLSEGGPVLLNTDSPVERSFTSLRTAMSGSVRGTVESTPENSAVAVVVLVPVGDYMGEYGFLMTAKPDGTFGAGGLASGSYYAAAFLSLDMAGLRDPELLRHIVEADEKVSVQVGSTTELKLKALDWPE